MHTSGIVRKIDELGRIVVPKEIRKQLRIKDGENLEIIVENENIVLKKYNIMKSIEDFAYIFTDVIHSTVKHNVLITNGERVIASSGLLKKKLLGKEISSYLINSINNKEIIYYKHPTKIEITDNEQIEVSYVISPIILQGDSVGSVIFISEDASINEQDVQVCQIVTKFFSKYLDE